MLEVVILGSDPEDNLKVTYTGGFQRPIAMDHLLLSQDNGIILFSDSERHVISKMHMNGTGINMQ